MHHQRHHGISLGFSTPSHHTPSLTHPLLTLSHSHLEHQCTTKDTMELASGFQHANGSTQPHYDPISDALGTIYYDDIHNGTTLLDDHYDVCLEG